MSRTFVYASIIITEVPLLALFFWAATRGRLS